MWAIDIEDNKSYLTARCQRIILGDCLSSKADLKYGVPEGSVLCPLLFILYTTPLSSMISAHTIPHHLDADDSQVYVSFASGDSAAALNGLQSCLASVQSWMLMNKPKPNSDKTEFPFRILFKFNLLTYRTLREKQPVYLHYMLAASIPSCSLRSSNDNSLSVPSIKANTGARTFHSCTPSPWNNFPLSVHSASSVIIMPACPYAEMSGWGEGNCHIKCCHLTNLKAGSGFGCSF